MDERAQRVSDLLHEAGEVHHVVYRITDGAITRVPEDAMAFGRGREAPFNFLVDAGWADPATDEENVAWARSLAAAMKPFTSGSAYLNFIGDEGRDRVQDAFGDRAYRRLQALKDRYDPDNLFRHNQNIEPSGALARAGVTGGER